MRRYEQIIADFQPIIKALQEETDNDAGNLLWMDFDNMCWEQNGTRMDDIEGYFIEFPEGVRIDLLDETGDGEIFYLNTRDDWYTEAKFNSLQTRIAWLLEEV